MNLPTPTPISKPSQALAQSQSSNPNPSQPSGYVAQPKPSGLNVAGNPTSNPTSNNGLPNSNNTSQAGGYTVQPKASNVSIAQVGPRQPTNTMVNTNPQVSNPTKGNQGGKTIVGTQGTGNKGGQQGPSSGVGQSGNQGNNNMGVQQQGGNANAQGGVNQQGGSGVNQQAQGQNSNVQGQSGNVQQGQNNNKNNPVQQNQNNPPIQTKPGQNNPVQQSQNNPPIQTKPGQNNPVQQNQNNNIPQGQNNPTKPGQNNPIPQQNPNYPNPQQKQNNPNPQQNPAQQNIQPSNPNISNPNLNNTNINNASLNNFPEDPRINPKKNQQQQGQNVKTSQEVNRQSQKWDPYQEYKKEMDQLRYNPYDEVNKTHVSQDLNGTLNKTLNKTVNKTQANVKKEGKEKTFNRDNVVQPKELKQLDAFYIDQIFQEIQGSLKQGPEFDQVQKDFKKFANKFHRKYESELLRTMNEEKKNTLFREISRMFVNEAPNQAMMSKIKRVVGYRLEELKRETRDNKWTILILLFSFLMNWNLYNKDQFERFNCLELPNDLRQKVWAMCLEEKDVTTVYRKQCTENKMLTISQFDVQIAKDCESFVSKHMLVEAFDPKMIYTMKIILSYYERKQDRILSDYHYLICMPLMKVFGNSHYIMNPPSELVGYYYKIAKMVKDIDPLVDLGAKHDEKYDALMTDLFMNALYRLDEDITDKVTQLLNLDLVQQRNLLVMLVKRFVHSLGFEFLNLRITLYVWDHMIMRVYPMGIEIFIVMAISMICLKDKVMAVATWDNLVDMYYKQAKMIDFRQFAAIYEEKFKDFNFYEPVYKDAELSEVEYSVDYDDNVAQDQSVIQDVTKKASVKPKINKHSTLLNRLQKKGNEESQIREADPELEQALAQNLKHENMRHGEQVGMFPYVNMDEEDGEDLLD